MKKYITFFALIGIFCLINQNGISQVSEGGIPLSFSLGIDVRNLPAIEMPPVDTEKLLREDANPQNVKEQKPFRFGYAIDVDIDIKKAGTLEILPNGDKIWLLKIYSPNAFSLNFIYNQFHLGYGSTFFIYNEDETMILGAFTPELSNNSDNLFATDLVQGNTIVLEYYEPVFIDNGMIHISKVIHGYIDMFGDRSSSCHADANCTAGNSWSNEKRSIAKVIIGEYVCTGCLINNTKQDLTPYFLTANHCYFDEMGNPKPGRDPKTTVFNFGYLKSGCGTGSTSTGNSLTGATLRAHDGWTDFALLELQTKPPANYSVYYAGWFRSFSETGGTVVGLHHPAGDVMKISVGWIKDAISWWGGQTKTHWQAIFSIGTVQGGSSGSPLFMDHNHKIVGQLSGNHNTQCVPEDDECFCESENKLGEYGRFDLSWSGNGSKETRLKDWLDPDKTGVYSLDGMDGLNCFENLTNQTISSNKIIKGCATLNIKDVTINNSATVVITADKEVIIKPGFHAVAGTDVSISINPTSLSPPQNLLVINNETINSLEDEKKTEVPINKRPSFTLFPNPNPGTFQIETNFPLDEITNFKITNSLGATVYETQNLFLNTIQLPTSVSGLHFVVAMLKTGTVLTQKMMVQR